MHRRAAMLYTARPDPKRSLESPTPMTEIDPFADKPMLSRNCINDQLA